MNTSRWVKSELSFLEGITPKGMEIQIINENLRYIVMEER